MDRTRKLAQLVLILGIIAIITVVGIFFVDTKFPSPANQETSQNE